MLSEHF